MSLDITFSDHQYSDETLAEFGGVIKAIGEVSQDPYERFWAFLQYVSTYHPSILAITLEGDMPARIKRVLDAITLPPVTVKPSWKMEALSEKDQVDGNT
ncbi:MAG: hypothetical protein ACO1TE_29325 [Prosthecobacter sp.]